MISQSFDKSFSYNVGLCNYDILGINNPASNISSRVSFEFIDVLKNLDDYIEEDRNIILNIREYTPEEYEFAKMNCDNGQIDSLLIFPMNFSECIFGSTWWYQYIYAGNSTYFWDQLASFPTNNIMTFILSQINGTDFPLNSPPELISYSTPLFFDQLALNYIYNSVLNSLINAYNQLKSPSISIIDRNGIPKQNINYFEYDMPGFIVLLTLIPIATISVGIVKEKQNRMLRTIDITENSRLLHLMSFITVDMGIVCLQIILLFLTLSLSDLYYHPSLDWFGLLIILLMLTFFSCNLGLIIGLKTSSLGAASMFSVMFLFGFEIFGDLFFETGTWISNLLPLKYVLQCVSWLIIEGKSGFQLLNYYGIVGLFGIISFIILIVFAKTMKSNDFDYYQN